MSNKPPEGYADHVAKIDRYVTILCGPAMERDGVSPLTFRKVRSEGEESVFTFTDTLTSRAEISDLARLFKDEVVAIIGLGGTGSYVLDFLVKTPVARILGFDRDPYHVHNAFRSPGRLLDEGELDHPKAEVYQGRYENFREGLTLTAKNIDESCVEDLKGVTFAFVCVDKGSSRRAIFDLLMKLAIPFIDVGMGLDRKQGPINGMLRATYYEPAHAQFMRDRDLAELSDREDDEYRVNVQIGELNALNACLAVVRYKQLKGFYLDENNFDHMLFKVNDIKVHGEARCSRPSASRVEFIPKALEPGVLYAADEYDIAAHLCACGCGTKVTTPLGPTEWRVTEKNGLPTLSPSVGNWQLPCRSHYLIIAGKTHWAGQWSEAQVKAGRGAEELRRAAYYAARGAEQSLWARFWKWLKGLCGR
jgi:hypothetical protein